MIGIDSYYGRPEVSNSDLLELKKYFLPSDVVMDLEKIFRFGNLVDAMITEPHRCDHIKRMVDLEQFTEEEWDLSKNMLNAFRGDDFCQQMMKLCSGQAVHTDQDFKIEHEGIEFVLPMRCKYDMYSDKLKYGGDIKSTAATTQKQFEEAFYHFDYDQSRAVYMDISRAKKDFVIGISKKPPHKIFKIFITKESNIYKSGKEKYQELGFRWWTLFGEINQEVMV